MRPTGTKEWARKTHDIATGCNHDCLYCYSKDREVRRFKRVKKGEWKNMKLRPKSVAKNWRKTSGNIMFPSSHDIVPEILDECVTVIKKMAIAWDRVIVVTKPHFECIVRLCNELEEYKDKILFRFTIGSMNNEVLKFWEPNAPPFEERFTSLKYAFDKGFRTSVSCEPFLDENIRELFHALEPYVTDSIWIGLLNKMETRVDKELRNTWTPKEWSYWNRVKACQTPGEIKKLYDDLKNESKVRWKDSIKQLLGLPTPKEIGMDV